jgi:cytochrome P450
LLGKSVFVTNGETWKRQRRIIDPAFEGGRLRDTFRRCWRPARRRWRGLQARPRATRRDRGRDQPCGGGRDLSHAVFDPDRGSRWRARCSRSSAPISARSRREPWRLPAAAALDAAVSFGARPRRRRAIRALITQLTAARMAEIEAGTAPDDLATKIMTTRDPETGEMFRHRRDGRPGGDLLSCRA